MQPVWKIVATRIVAFLTLFLAIALAWGAIPAQALAIDGAETLSMSAMDCSLETLHGTYLFQAQGVIADGDGAHPYAEAGVWTLDGAGNGEGVFSAGLASNTIVNRQHFTATYEVVSGCAFAAFAPIGDENFEFHLFTSPAGAMITYYSDGFSGTMWRQEPSEAEQKAAAIIESAVSAAPNSVSAEAAVWDWPSESHPDVTVVRTGVNGWTCLPDDPATPGNDPMCLDEQWVEWLSAIFEGRDPEITTYGWAYMLQGGSGASDSDPFQMEPLEGEDWLVGPPHLMLIGPEPFDADDFPTDRSSGEPYIMWAGTPYEHFMIPVELGIPSDTDAPIANAMSAGPASISADATVWAWPTEDNPEFEVLRAGNNGWTCLPDDPATPTNDPMCLDARWVVWLEAIFAGEDPGIDNLGWAYMLQGGSGASDSDPSVMVPEDGGEWLIGPPHVMLIAPDTLDADLFPTGRSAGYPYIMWAGTPYEHFMSPTEDMAAD